MMIALKPRYMVVVQWLEEDDCFVVSFPEWGEFCHTHGATYVAAIANAQEILEMLIEGAVDRGEDLPVSQTFHPIVANVA